MLIAETDAEVALHTWINLKRAPYWGRPPIPVELNRSMHMLGSIMPLLFLSLDYLYIETRNIPSQWGTVIPKRIIKMRGTDNFITANFPSSDNYLRLRGILSFTRDVYSSTKALKSRDLFELSPLVKKLYDSSNKFREIRNYFTHLDEVLSNPSKHWITGSTYTSPVIEYVDTAVDCGHLIFSGNKIYFTS